MKILLILLVLLLSIPITIVEPPVKPQVHMAETVRTNDVKADTLVEPQKDQEYREVYAEVTYYTASEDECGKSDGITASGTQATEGRTIAMSDEIPFGTKVIIDNHEYIVEDRGGAIEGNKVDVFVNDKTVAFKLGRQQKLIKIIEK